MGLPGLRSSHAGGGAAQSRSVWSEGCRVQGNWFVAAATEAATEAALAGEEVDGSGHGMRPVRAIWWTAMTCR